MWLFIICHIAVSNMAPWIPLCTRGRSSFTGWRGIVVVMGDGCGLWPMVTVMTTWWWRWDDGGEEAVVDGHCRWWWWWLRKKELMGWRHPNQALANADTRFGHCRFCSSHSGAIPSMWFPEPFHSTFHQNSFINLAGNCAKIDSYGIPGIDRILPDSGRNQWRTVKTSNLLTHSIIRAGLSFSFIYQLQSPLYHCQDPARFIQHPPCNLLISITRSSLSMTGMWGPRDWPPSSFGVSESRSPPSAPSGSSSHACSNSATSMIGATVIAMFSGYRDMRTTSSNWWLVILPAWRVHG